MIVTVSTGNTSPLPPAHLGDCNGPTGSTSSLFPTQLSAKYGPHWQYESPSFQTKVEKLLCLLLLKNLPLASRRRSLLLALLGFHLEDGKALRYGTLGKETWCRDSALQLAVLLNHVALPSA